MLTTSPGRTVSTFGPLLLPTVLPSSWYCRASLRRLVSPDWIVIVGVGLVHPASSRRQSRAAGTPRRRMIGDAIRRQPVEIVGEVIGAVVAAPGSMGLRRTRRSDTVSVISA